MISGHSRDIGCLVILSIWNIGIGWKKEKKMETGRGKASPFVSIKDRSLSGPVIEFELY